MTKASSQTLPYRTFKFFLEIDVVPVIYIDSFFHYDDDALESPFCGFDFIVCINVASNR